MDSRSIKAIVIVSRKVRREACGRKWREELRALGGPFIGSNLLPAPLGNRLVTTLASVTSVPQLDFAQRMD